MRPWERKVTLEAAGGLFAKASGAVTVRVFDCVGVCACVRRDSECVFGLRKGD